MVVLSAAIMSKTGKALLARQFSDSLTKMRVEGLLTALPKLMQAASQHTFTETDEVRYLYRSLEDGLVLVLITSKSSNVLEDLQTLTLLAGLIPEYIGGAPTEAAVTENVFDLVFAFDEVISLGHRESVTIQQVKTYTEMDSHEEKLQRIILESKVNEARDLARRKAEAINKQKAELRRQAPSMSSSSYEGRGGYNSSSSNNNNNSRGGGRDSYENQQFSSETTSTPTSSSDFKSSAASAASGKPRGMQLGKKKRPTDDFFSAISKEERLPAFAAKQGGGLGLGSSSGVGGMGMGGAAAAAPEVKESVKVTIEEKLTCVMGAEGDVSKLEVKGEMVLTVFDPDDAKLEIHTGKPLKKADGFQVRLHPKIDKSAYNKSGIIRLKDKSKMFPIGSDNAPAVLKWRFQSSEEDDVPFVINFWPSTEDGRSVVSAELTYGNPNLHPENIYISIPCAAGEPPQVSAISESEYNYNPKDRMFVWFVPSLSADLDTASIEFSLPEVDAESFYPINVSFTSQETFSKVSVDRVAHVDNTDVEIEFAPSVFLRTDSFAVQQS